MVDNDNPVCDSAEELVVGSPAMVWQKISFKVITFTKCLQIYVMGKIVMEVLLVSCQANFFHPGKYTLCCLQHSQTLHACTRLWKTMEKVNPMN